MASRDHSVARARGRSGPTREVGKSFLVVCEGATEVEYFTFIQRTLREAGLKVRAIEGDSSDPLEVVRTAERMKRKYGATYNYYWAVFDEDGKGARFTDALDLAEKKRIRVAYSNPSIEVWFLWHFCDFNRDCDQRTVEAELAKKANWPGFLKGRRFDARALGGRFPDATRRARRARESHERLGRSVPDDRPTSRVDELVALIIESWTARTGRTGPPL